MNLRDAAEMALECLNYHWDNLDSELEEWPYVVEAKQALRQALAQPDLAKVGEVGVWGNSQALAHLEQEPVGYAHIEDLKREHHDFWVNRERGVNEVPLYIAPPKQWVGLEAEEVGALTVFDGLFYVETPLLADFIRAIEAKLKEKNT